METQLKTHFIHSGAKIFHFKIDQALLIIDAIQQARQQTNKLLNELLEDKQIEDEPQLKKKIKLEQEDSQYTD